jgi:hypothetical protein
MQAVIELGRCEDKPVYNYTLSLYSAAADEDVLLDFLRNGTPCAIPRGAPRGQPCQCIWWCCAALVARACRARCARMPRRMRRGLTLRAVPRLQRGRGITSTCGPPPARPLLHTRRTFTAASAAAGRWRMRARDSLPHEAVGADTLSGSAWRTRSCARASRCTRS